MNTEKTQKKLNALDKKTGLEEAMEDVEAGRVFKCESVEDLINQVG